MINKYVIYGERCSGTNYLQELMEMNFKVKLTNEFGHKHFFGFNRRKLLNTNTNNVLFICIVRDITKWLNSLYRTPHHLKHENCLSTDKFLNKPSISYQRNPKAYNGRDNQGQELQTNRNIYTHEQYKNIYELRHTKIKFLKEDLPKLVKHTIFIKYEDLLTNFENTMNKIRQRGLPIKRNIRFPLNSTHYKNCKNIPFKPQSKPIVIDHKLILNNPNYKPHYEKELGYI